MENLYYVYNDGDGHRYLIPKEQEFKFFNLLQDVEYDYSIHKDYELYCEELEFIVGQYSKLEGEEYYIVLKSELEE